MCDRRMGWTAEINHGCSRTITHSLNKPDYNLMAPCSCSHFQAKTQSCFCTILVRSDISMCRVDFTLQPIHSSFDVHTDLLTCTSSCTFWVWPLLTWDWSVYFSKQHIYLQCVFECMESSIDITARHEYIKGCVLQWFYNWFWFKDLAVILKALYQQWNLAWI